MGNVVGGLRPSVVRLTIPDPAEQVPLVARSVTPPSPPTSPSEMMERGDDTARSTLWGPSAACTSILDRVCYDHPYEHTSEGGRDDRGVPYHAACGIDPIQCSSAQVSFACLQKKRLSHCTCATHGGSGRGTSRWVPLSKAVRYAPPHTHSPQGLT